MSKGSILIYTSAAGQAAPLPSVTLTVTDAGGSVRARLVTDADGFAEATDLPAPDAAYSLDAANTTVQPYALYRIEAALDGWQPLVLNGVQVFDAQQTVARLNLLPAGAAPASAISRTGEVETDIVTIPPHTLFAGNGCSGPAPEELLPGSVLALPDQAVQRLIKLDNGDAALLYLCLTAGQNSGALPWGPDQVEAAQNTLLRLGLISSDTPVQPPRPEKLEDDRPPDYTTQDIAQAFQNDGGFKALVPAVEQMLGKVLSPADLKILYTLFDFLALPPEVILTLTGWCVEQAKQKGPGRKPTLTQIRREAYKWQKAGIDTLEAADAHLHRLSRRNRRGTEILQLLFGESRAPVEKEAEFLDAWIQMGCSDELLLLARDRTIFQLQEFKWTYMNGILTRWYKEGLTTVEAVEASERKNRRPQYPRATPQPAQGAQPLPSDDIGRMIEQARRAAAAKEG